MSWLSVCLLACQFTWTSQHALGSCDYLLRSCVTDNPNVFQLACVKTSPDALGSCCGLLSCVKTSSGAPGCCYCLRSVKTKEIKIISTNSNIILTNPLGRGEAMTTNDCPSVSPDAHSASSMPDSETNCLSTSLSQVKNTEIVENWGPYFKSTQKLRTGSTYPVKKKYRLQF